MMVLFAGIKFLSGAGWMSVSVVPAKNLALCNTQRSTPSARACIVDGDTLWLNGVNVRLKDFDTPESHRNICESFIEIDRKRCPVPTLRLR